MLAISDYDEALALSRAQRDRELARARLDRAEPEFGALDMTMWLARAAALRADLERSAGHPDGLSERELEVLALLASGMANKQIAAQLYVSVPTIERHVANIYEKTGARGRANATAYALRHGLTRS